MMVPKETSQRLNEYIDTVSDEQLGADIEALNPGFMERAKPVETTENSVESPTLKVRILKALTLASQKPWGEEYDLEEMAEAVLLCLEEPNPAWTVEDLLRDLRERWTRKRDELKDMAKADGTGVGRKQHLYSKAEGLDIAIGDLRSYGVEEEGK